MTNRKIRILHVTHSMEIGGAEQVIVQLVNGLDSNLYSNSVVCIDGRIGSMSSELTRNGIEIFSIPRQSGLDRSVIKNLRAFVKEREIDIVHCHQYTPYTYGAISAAFTKTKVIFTEHGRFYPDRYTWKRRVVNQLLVRVTHSIVAISISTKMALAKYEWIPQRRVSVIYNGLKPVSSPALSRSKTRAELAYTDNDVVLGTISRLDPIKNQNMMIEALATLVKTNSNTKLLFVGDGPELSSLKEKVATLQLADYVTFVGYKTDPEPYLQAIDIFLLTSYSEGTSMTLLEAMAAGKPSIATNVGGNPEILEHESDGILVSSNDTKALVSAVNLLLNNPELTLKISQNSIEKFKNRFELSLMIKNYQKLYDKLGPGN